MAQITTTNRQAILELIPQADETTEVAGLSASVTQLQIEVAGLSASIGNEINLGDFIVVDVPSGVATFSASQSIVNQVNSGGTSSTSLSPLFADIQVYDNSFTSKLEIINENATISSVGGIYSSSIQVASDTITTTSANSDLTSTSTQTIAPIQIISTSTDGTNTTTETITTSSYNTTSTDGTYTSYIDTNPTSVSNGVSDGLSTSYFDISYGSTNIIDNDGIGTQSNIDIQVGSITTTSTDGTNTNYVSVSPNILDITFTDGTKSNTIYSEYNDLTGNHLIEMNVNNGSSLSSAIVLGQNNITGLSNIILDAGDKNYDATTYSQVSIANDYVKQEVINGNITSTFLIDPLGKIDQTKLEETNGTDTTYIRIGADNFTISTDTGTTANQIATSINNISLSSTDGVDNKIIEITPTYINITGLQSFDDDAAAGTGGLAAGNIYQTTGNGASPLDVAGILMIKQ